MNPYEFCRRCGGCAVESRLIGFDTVAFQCGRRHIWHVSRQQIQAASTPHYQSGGVVPALGTTRGSHHWALSNQQLFAGTPPPAPPKPEPDSPPAEPPEHLTGKIIGYRGWTLDGYRLKSANVQQHGGCWKVAVNRAECLIHKRIEFLGGRRPAKALLEPHDAPHPACECGLYAYFEVRRENNPHNFGTNDLMWGAVTAWGRVEVHAEGFRAEFAQPVVLAYDPRQPYEDVVRAQTLAGEFDLPFVTLAELVAEARKFGQEVPESMRPEWQMYDPSALSPQPLATGAHYFLLTAGHPSFFGIAPTATPKPAPEPPTRKRTRIREQLKTVGPPYHGKYRQGDIIADRKGVEWLCVKGGKPGSWTEHQPET